MSAQAAVASQAKRPRFRSRGCEVDDVDKVYNYLKLKGVEFISPPQVADLTPETPGKDLIKIATAKDPDGIFVQLEEFIRNQDWITGKQVNDSLFIFQYDTNLYSG